MSELDDIEQTDAREEPKEPEEPESPDVLERAWRDHDKYVCGICRFMRIDNREAVEDHIERAH